MAFESFDPMPHLRDKACFEDLMSQQDREEMDDLIKKVREMWSSEPLTPMQRIIAAMMGGDIDRVPYTALTPKKIGMDKLGVNYVELYMDPVANAKAGLVTTLACQADGVSGLLPIDMNMSDVFGTKWKFLPHTLPVATEWAVKKGFEDILENPLPDPRESHALKWQLESERFLSERLGDLGPCSAGTFILGPYYQYNSCLRGPVEGFADIKKNPDLAVKAFDKLYEYLVDIAKYYIEKTAMPMGMIVDSLAAPSFTSPAWFEKYCAPYNKRILQDVPAVWTIAGGGQGQTDFTPLLATYAEMGYNTFMFGPPTDLLKMKEISNEKGTNIMYWALTQQMLHWYSPQEIDERVKEVMKIGAPGQKFVMSNDVPDDETTAETFVAIKEAILKYGKYPLSFDD